MDKEKQQSGGGTPCRRNFYNSTGRQHCLWCIILKILATPTVKAAFKWLALVMLWQFLEVLFYGEVQPRIVDDIIGFFLWYYIYKSEYYKDK